MNMNINLLNNFNFSLSRFSYFRDAIAVSEEYKNCINKIMRIGYTKEDAIKFIAENANHDIAFDNAMRNMWRAIK